MLVLTLSFVCRIVECVISRRASSDECIDCCFGVSVGWLLGFLVGAGFSSGDRAPVFLPKYHSSGWSWWVVVSSVVAIVALSLCCVVLP